MNTCIVKVLVLLGLVSSLYAHSWLHCADYRIETPTDEEIYDATKCMGYPRGWKDCCSGTRFGLDRGYNFSPAPGALPCANGPSSPLSAAYDDSAPMAKYAPGQKVCLAWPPKNHVAASCDNPNIPDNGLKVYMIGPDATADVPTDNAMLVKDFGANPGTDAYEAFQNCPKYCDDHDSALCTGCFNVPVTVQVGKVYTFYWLWAFNSPTDYYSSCWEAEIVSTAPGSGGSSGSSGGNNQGNEEEEVQVPCTSNKDCKNGVCSIEGYCKEPSGASGQAATAALVLGIIAAVVIVGIVAVFFFRDRVANSLPYSIKRRTR